MGRKRKAKKGILLTCQKCQYQWTYRPSKIASSAIPARCKLTATCPRCNSSVPFALSEAKILELGFKSVDAEHEIGIDVVIPETGIFQPKYYSHNEWTKRKQRQARQEEKPTKEEIWADIFKHRSYEYYKVGGE